MSTIFEYKSEYNVKLVCHVVADYLGYVKQR